MTLRSSRFNLIRRLRTDRAVAFNTWSEVMIALPPAVAEALDREDWSGVSPLWLGKLLRHGFVIRDQVDERRRALERVQSHLRGSVLQIIAVPSWSCNLSCSYCYEATGEPAPRRQARRGWAASVSRFVAARLATGEERSVVLALFGGEPLLKAGLCADLAAGVRTAAAAAGVPFLCTLTTNGTILGAETRRLLREVDAVQVTLDGAGADHDRLRFTAGGRSTFDTIFDFLDLAREAGARLIIRHHLHGTSAGELEQAAREILERLGTDSDVCVYFSPVTCGSYVDAFTDCGGAAAQAPDLALFATARDRFLAAGWHAESVQLYEKGSSRMLPCAVRCGYLNQRTLLVDPALRTYFCSSITCSSLSGGRGASPAVFPS